MNIKDSYRAVTPLLIIADAFNKGSPEIKELSYSLSGFGNITLSRFIYSLLADFISLDSQTRENRKYIDFLENQIDDLENKLGSDFVNMVYKLNPSLQEDFIDDLKQSCEKIERIYYSGGRLIDEE